MNATIKRASLTINYAKAVAWLSILVLLLAVVGLWCWWILVYNPLISDEEMLDHFNTHREKLEEVVRRYRDFEVQSGVDASKAWLDESGTKALIKEASVYRVVRLIPYWVPEPYSEKAEQKKSNLKDKLGIAGFRRRHGTLGVELSSRAGFDKKFRDNTLFYGLIWKRYVFFPEEPRVEGGWLYWPATRSGYQPKKRVVSSLNYIPENWGSYECVYRRLTEHWFLTMCNGR